MKKFIRNNIFGFLIGIILCSGIVYAASYFASDISYTKDGWEVNNVKDAIDDLYLIQQEKGNKNAFSKLFPDYSLNISHETSYTYYTPYTNITDDYFESYVHWGKTAKSITGVTNAIDLTDINSIILDYEFTNSQGSEANQAYLQFIAESGTATTLIHFGHTGRTTRTIDVSSITGTGRFHLYQYVGGGTGDGYNNKLIVYDIKFQ